MSPISRILWGDGYENAVVFKVGSGDVVTDRPPRDGSEFVQGRSGVEDAWITGRDYTLRFDQRFIPEVGADVETYTPLAGSRSFQEFLDWARDKNPFRFVPDQTYPDFWIPDCYLVEPLQGGGTPMATMRHRAHALVLRNATYDFDLALRGLFTEYQAGGLVSAGGWTFARSAAANYRGRSGVASAAAAVLRDRHFVGANRVALLEGTEDNKWTRSQELDHADWPRSGLSAVTANATTAPDGTATAEKMIEDGASAVHGLSRDTPALGDNLTHVASIFAKADTRSWVYIRTGDKAGTIRRTWFNLTTGVIGTKDAGHSAWIEAASLLGDGWYRCAVAFSSASGGTAPEVVYAMATGDNVATYAGDGASGLFVWGAQFEQNRAYPTSYVATTTAVVTRAADSMSRSWPWKPQAMWAYMQWIERGTIGAVSAGLWEIFQSTAQLTLYTVTANTLRAYHSNGSAAVASDLPAGVTPAFGDVAEALVLLNTDGSIQVKGAKNGGAEQSGSVSAAAALAASWGATAALRFNEEATNKGLLGLQTFRCGPGVAVSTIAQARAA